MALTVFFACLSALFLGLFLVMRKDKNYWKDNYLKSTDAYGKLSEKFWKLVVKAEGKENE